MKRSNRGVTDWYFVLIYLAFVGTLVVITIYAHINGNPMKFMYPIDSNGTQCLSSETSNKTKLLILDYHKIEVFSSIFSLIFRQRLMLSYNSICIDKCPTFMGVPTIEEFSCRQNTNITDNKTLWEEIGKNNCAKLNIPTFEVLNYCLPDFKKIQNSTMSFKEVVDSIGEGEIIDFVRQVPVVFSKITVIFEIIDEFKATKNFLILYFVISIFISMIVVLAFGYGTYAIFMILYSVSLVISVTGVVICSMSYYGQPINFAQSEKIQWIQYQIDEYLNQNESSGYMAFWFLFSIITLSLLCLGCCLHKVIDKVCTYAKDVSKATMFLMLNAIIPIISVTIQIAYMALWGYILLCILTSDKQNYRFLKISNGSVVVGETCSFTDTASNIHDGCIFAGIYTTRIHLIMLSVSFFVILWGVLLTRGVSTYLVSYSYYQYYWKKNTEISLSLYFSILKGIRSLLVYNIGSIIFGSFLIAIATILCLFLRLIVKCIGITENNSKVFVRWVRRIMLTIQQILLKLSERSYIEVVVSRKNFLRCTLEVLAVFVSNPALTIIIEIFNAFFLYCGSMMVSLATGSIAYYHITNAHETFRYPILYPVMIGFGALIVSLSVMSIYTTGITTIHYCYYHYHSLGN